MSHKIDHIILSSEMRNKPEGNVEDAFTDVLVKMENGELFGASFFSYDYIEQLRHQHSNNGYYLSGSYFWAERMILVEDCDKARIENIIREMIDEGDFLRAFTKFD